MEKKKKKKKKINIEFLESLCIGLWLVLELRTLFYKPDTYIGMKGLKVASLCLILSMLSRAMFAVIIGLLASIIIGFPLSLKGFSLENIKRVVIPLTIIGAILFTHSDEFNWYYKNEYRRENQKVVLCEDFRLLYNLCSDIRSGDTKVSYSDDYEFTRGTIIIKATRSSTTKETYYVTFSGNEKDVFMPISEEDKNAVTYCMKPMEKNKISIYEKSGFLAAINDEVKTVTREEIEMKKKEAERKKEEIIQEKMKSIITITMDKNYIVTRTEPTERLENIEWIVTYNGEQVLGRCCERELSFNASMGRPGKYTICVATFYRGKYLPVSNTIEYGD